MASDGSAVVGYPLAGPSLHWSAEGLPDGGANECAVDTVRRRGLGMGVTYGYIAEPGSDCCRGLAAESFLQVLGYLHCGILLTRILVVVTIT